MSPRSRPRRRARAWRGLATAGLLLAAAACGAGDPAPGDPVVSGPIDLADPAQGEPSPSGRTLLEGFTEVTVVVTHADGTVEEHCVLLADDPAERARGLMEVVDLGDYPAMVFVFDDDTTTGFYMRNTPTPLTIAYLSSAGRRVSVADMAPCADRDGCPTYPADGPYRYAVEVPQGALGSVGLDDPGAALALGGRCAPTT